MCRRMLFCHVAPRAPAQKQSAKVNAADCRYFARQKMPRCDAIENRIRSRHQAKQTGDQPNVNS